MTTFYVNIMFVDTDDPYLENVPLDVLPHAGDDFAIMPSPRSTPDTPFRRLDTVLRIRHFVDAPAVVGKPARHAVELILGDRVPALDDAGPPRHDLRGDT